MPQDDLSGWTPKRPDQADPHRKGDGGALNPVQAVPHWGDVGKFIPDMEEVDYSIVRTEVVLKLHEIIVHIFPRDPKLLVPVPELENRSPIRALCEGMLPVRFPEVRGRYVITRQLGIPLSACLIMPRTRQYAWAPDYFRTEFPRLLAQGLAAGG